MFTFKYNNVSCADYDIVVREHESILLPKRDIETIKVDGRNGFLTVDNETYDSYSITIKCVVLDDSEINDIKAWLTPTGIIEFSDNEGVYYDCVIKNQISLDKYLTVLNEFPLQLELNPVGKSTSLTTVTKTTSPATFTVGGSYNNKPIIEIKGTGTATITINSVAFTLTDLTSTATIVDCDLMNITKNSLRANDKFAGTFTDLIVGTNTLSWVGDVSEVKIKYRTGWL